MRVEKVSSWVYAAVICAFSLGLFFFCYEERWEIPRGKVGVLSKDNMFGSWSVEKIYNRGPVTRPHYSKFSRSRKMEYLDENLLLFFEVQGRIGGQKSIAEKARSLFSAAKPEEKNYALIKGEVSVALTSDAIGMLMDHRRSEAFLTSVANVTEQELPALITEASDVQTKISNEISKRLKTNASIKLLTQERQKEELAEKVLVKVKTIGTISGEIVSVFRWDKLWIGVPIVALVMVFAWFMGRNFPMLTDLLTSFGSWF